MVPGGGVEPPRGCPRRILSPLRLPVPPSRLFQSLAHNVFQSGISHFSHQIHTGESSTRPKPRPHPSFQYRIARQSTSLNCPRFGQSHAAPANTARIAIHCLQQPASTASPPKTYVCQFLRKLLINMRHPGHAPANHNHIRIKNVDHLRQPARKTVFESLHRSRGILDRRPRTATQSPVSSAPSPSLFL